MRHLNGAHVPSGPMAIGVLGTETTWWLWYENITFRCDPARFELSPLLVFLLHIDRTQFLGRPSNIGQMVSMVQV